MSSAVLVAYATRYGSTQEVAEAIAKTLRESGLTVDVQPAKAVRSLADYGAVVMGAPLIMYHWHKDALNFLSRHREALGARPVALFALGPVKNPHDDKEWQDSRVQLDKELAKYPWLKPIAVEVLGGVFDPKKLSFPMSWFAGKEPASDARDWDAIRTWAMSLSEKLESALE